MSARDTIRDFNKLYYDKRLYSFATYRDTQLLKYPTDLWIYGELIWRVRPDVIIETGTFAGGFALFCADWLDRIGHGVVLTIDVEDWSGLDGYPAHHRIEYLSGSSTEHEVVAAVTSYAEDGTSVMVVLDSNHTRDHVLAELDTYGPLVTRGSYLIVEDTNVHQVRDDYGDGPDDALAKWLPEHPEFVIDRECERFMLTAAPGGWLRRV